MLTGDKVETATCIAISTGIKQKKEQLFYMRDLYDSFEIQKKLEEFSRRATNSILMIDG